MFQPIQRLRAAAAVCASVAATVATAATVQPQALYAFPRAYANAYDVGAMAESGDGRILVGTGRTLYLRCGSLLALAPETRAVTALPMPAKTMGCVVSPALATDAQGTVWGSTASKGPGRRGTLFHVAPGAAPAVAFAYTDAYGNGATASPTPAPMANGQVAMPRYWMPGQLYGNVLTHPLAGGAPSVAFTGDAEDPAHLGSLLAVGDTLYGVGVNGYGRGGGSAFYRIDGPTQMTALANLMDHGIVAGSLVHGRDGQFYITVTTIDGVTGKLLRISPSGTATVLHEFSGPDGRNPATPVLARDGWLYGTSGGGGAQDQGVIYRLRPDGSGFEVLYAFGSRAVGAYGGVTLLEASDGYFYGRTRGGARHGNGAIYRFAPPAP